MDLNRTSRRRRLTGRAVKRGPVTAGLALLATATVLVGSCGTSGDGFLAGPPTEDSTAGQPSDPLGRERFGDDAPLRISIEALGTEDFLDAVEDDVEGYWRWYLIGEGEDAPKVHTEWPDEGESVDSDCTDGTDDYTAQYCPDDDTIVISQHFATQIQEGDINLGTDHLRTDYSGDLALAYVVAHEYAHNVQDELGELDLNGPVVGIELQADCWAGVWTRSATDRQLLEDGDPRQAIAVARLVGDDEVELAGHHGTAEERSGAFLAGYQSGEPDACAEYEGAFAG